MESMYDVVITFNASLVFSIDGLLSLANAMSIIETNYNLNYETAVIYGYDDKETRYIVHTRQDPSDRDGAIAHNFQVAG
jgi:hypothetical protein